jgi:hypothetical protein
MAEETTIDKTADRDTSITERDHDSGRQESLRASIEKAWETHSGHKPESRDDQDDQYEQDRREDRRAEPKGRAARAAKDAASADAASATNKAESSDGAARPAVLGQSADAPPTAWAKEAKAHFASLPPAVKQAVLKRESDIARGVEQLKSHYSEIDQALAPFAAAIRQHNAAPGAAISRLFQWHQYLQRDPMRGFAELAQTYGLTLQQLAEAAGGAQQQQPQAGGVDQRYLRQLVQQEVAPIHQAMTEQQRWVQEQQAAKTSEILNQWAKDKPFFQDVRVLMARGIESGAVPLKDNAIDLDGAYSFACAAHPEVRERLYAQRTAAERKSASERAAQARRAGASLSPSSPGSFNAGKAKRSTGKTVRESLNEALSEARDSARY